jgi:hypothetical protein
LCEKNQEQDPEQIALEALDGLRHSDNFVSRVSNIPLVHRSIHQITNVYEATKNASNIVKELLFSS